MQFVIKKKLKKSVREANTYKETESERTKKNETKRNYNNNNNQNNSITLKFAFTKVFTVRYIDYFQ